MVTWLAEVRRVETVLPPASPWASACLQAGLREEGRLRTADGVLLMLARLDTDVDPGLDALPTIAASMSTVLRAAGWYLRDPDGRVLMVDPVYKDGLDLPGGVSEAEEDLRQSARRELLEELDLRLTPGALLALDFCGATSRRGQIELAVFEGGTHPATLIEGLTFPDGELSAAHWVHPDDLDGLAPAALVRRIRAIHDGYDTGRLPGPTILLREGHPAP